MKARSFLILAVLTANAAALRPATAAEAVRVLATRSLGSAATYASGYGFTNPVSRTFSFDTTNISVAWSTSLLASASSPPSTANAGASVSANATLQFNECENFTASFSLTDIATNVNDPLPPVSVSLGQSYGAFILAFAVTNQPVYYDLRMRNNLTPVTGSATGLNTLQFFVRNGLGDTPLPLTGQLLPSFTNVFYLQGQTATVTNGSARLAVNGIFALQPIGSTSCASLPGTPVPRFTNSLSPAYNALKDLIHADVAANLPSTEQFTSVPSGSWVDPPATFGFDYIMTGTARFTGILDFPTNVDADDQFTVSVGGTSLGSFSHATPLDFTSQLGTNVTAFRVTGIAPVVDADRHPFPLKLAFDTLMADFIVAPLQLPVMFAARPAAGQIALGWFGDARFNHQIQSSTNLQYWANEPVLVPGADDFVIVTNATDKVQKYFRVRME